ncbi:MAG: transcriptional repressor [Brevefilum sp.]|nr:transcriptional repressor [Brevefilum sp.]
MNLQDQLNHNGLRLTHPRQVVMSVLEAANIPLSPQSIHQRSLEAQEEIGLVSVYRTLDLLTELGLVRRVHGHEECQGYVLASPGHHHHVVCRQCEAAVEFTGMEDVSLLVERIQAQTGFTIDEHLLQFYGLCPACQEEVER